MSDDNKKSSDLLTPLGYLSFVNLFTPRATPDGREERYGTNLIIPKKMQETDRFKALVDAIRECAEAGFGKDWQKKNVRLPIRKGSERDYEGYDDDAVFIAPWSKMKPGVVDKHGNDILVPDEVYAGCVAQMTVRPFHYDQKGNKGVGLALGHVQVVAESKRLDGRKSAQDTFKDADADDLMAQLGLDVKTEDASGGLLDDMIA